MTPPSNSRAKRPAETWDSPGAPDALTPVEQLAHSIVTARADLRPSVQRIMHAELTAEQRTVALTLFDTALRTPGDPNRDPRIAIERCLGEAPT